MEAYSYYSTATPFGTETYSTSSIELVAAFITSADDVTFERDPGDDPDSDHVTFLVRGRNLSSVVKDWDKGQLHGNLTNYARSLKRVKSFLHSCQSRRRNGQ